MSLLSGVNKLYCVGNNLFALNFSGFYKSINNGNWSSITVNNVQPGYTPSTISSLNGDLIIGYFTYGNFKST